MIVVGNDRMPDKSNFWRNFNHKLKTKSMKSIKQIALGAFLALGALGTVTYTSCSKDECKDVVCQNSGTCTGGTCTCTTGYEGANCETASRLKFVKQWSASDKEATTSNTIPTYVSAIVAGTSVTDIRISNFSGLFTNDVIGTVSGSTITIASQQPDNDGYYVTTGTGTYNASTKQITWTYTLKNPLNVEKSYTGTWQ